MSINNLIIKDKMTISNDRSGVGEGTTENSHQGTFVHSFHFLLKKGLVAVEVLITVW